MPDVLIVKPDAEFIGGVMANGGSDLKKCFQCATCTATCVLASEDVTFPRQQVLKAQMGLKEKLIGDPGVWLCHNCGECTQRCPRGARPGDILGAVRSQVVKALAFPGFMGALVSDPLGVWSLFTIPFLVLAAIAMFPLRLDPARSMEFADLFPQARLEVLFFAISGLALLSFMAGVARFVRALRTAGATGPIVAVLPAVLLEIVRHRRFATCERQRLRYWGHLLLLLGFVGLGLVGTIIGAGSLAGIVHTPLPALSPLKLFANTCALLALIGVVTIFVNRLSDRQRRRATVYFDWFFLWILACALLTGIVSEALRLAQNGPWMFTVYFVHLVLVFTLLLYAPYSKFAHVVYRTVAMAAVWEQERQAKTTTHSPPAMARASD